MEMTSFIRNAFEHMVEGILFIDTNGCVLYANSAYLKFIHMTEEEIIGRKLRDVRPHAQLPSVVESGHRVLHAQRLEDLDEAYFVNMYPIFENGKVVGGVSVITFMDEAQRTRVELNNFESAHKNLLKQINQGGNRYTFDSIIAEDEKSIAIKEYASRLAESDMPILLMAESGTGKEMYAQAIHHSSSRKNEVFLAVNCAGFTKDMLDSELFGYMEGAFTGAKKGGKMGLFEAASGGTLFLDEISEMDYALQAKLLRALQEKKIRPVGAVKEYDINVRIICACNVDLKKRVDEGLFRKDLYYRISSFPIIIPPLRERKNDIPALIHEILRKQGDKVRRTYSINQDALDALVNYEWPGNVRELKNVVEFSAYMCTNATIKIEDLPEQIRYYGICECNEENVSLAERVAKFEQNEIRRLIDKHGNTVEGKKLVAKQLGISLATLYNKLGK
ncbi:MAG: sigma 54-interacting transcriptional regulator [Lachnospiraceae bacterium]|nr:sigma 54-interacting transcriptional regulator [Lachnospiraceae bacterium]